jgi:RNA polymerase sigma-70 factor, ECF subfamily
VADASDAFDERHLLRGLAAGEERAFADLYDRYGVRLYRTARRLLDRPDEAEDAVQDVFAALVRSRSELVHVRDLTAYLFAALRRQVGRRSQLQRRLPQTLVVDCPASQPSEDPRREALSEALRLLPEEQRTVIGLKIEGELTFAEIGRVLAISPNTAASRYRYALERLRERLRNE